MYKTPTGGASRRQQYLNNALLIGQLLEDFKKGEIASGKGGSLFSKFIWSFFGFTISAFSSVLLILLIKAIGIGGIIKICKWVGSYLYSFYCYCRNLCSYGKGKVRRFIPKKKNKIKLKRSLMLHFFQSMSIPPQATRILSRTKSFLGYRNKNCPLENIK